MKFPFICSKIPATPVYEVNVIQLLRNYRACGSYHDFLVIQLTRKLLNQWFPVKSSLRTFYMTPWLGKPLWNIYVTNDHRYVPFVLITTRYFLRSWPITGIVTRVTRQVPHVEQELLTLVEFTPVHGAWSLVVCVVLCGGFLSFSFGHCVVCSSSIYGFWLPLSYRQTFLQLLLPNLIVNKTTRTHYNSKQPQEHITIVNNHRNTLPSTCTGH